MKRMALLAIPIVLVLSGCSTQSEAEPAASTATPTPSAIGSVATVEREVTELDIEATADFEACLRAEGVEPVAHVEGQPEPVRDAKTQAAYTKCKAGIPEGAHVEGASGKRNTPQFAAFQSCMADQGITVGGPDTGGGGSGAVEGTEEEHVDTEIFGLDLTDKQTKTAVAACDAELAAAKKAAGIA